MANLAVKSLQDPHRKHFLTGMFKLLLLACEAPLCSSCFYYGGTPRKLHCSSKLQTESFKGLAAVQALVRSASQPGARE